MALPRCGAAAASGTAQSSQVGNDRRRIVGKDIFRLRKRIASVESMTAALLLAEPEPAIRGYLERQLQSDGFHVLHAAFGGEALALAERSRPDLVLCSELEALLRACVEGEPGRKRGNCDVPVIVLGPAKGGRGRPRARVPARRRRLPPTARSSTTSSSRASAPCSGGSPSAGAAAAARGRRPRHPPPGPCSVTVHGDVVHLAGKEFELLVRARRRAEARLHEGRAASRRLGLSLLHSARGRSTEQSLLRQKLKRGNGRPLCVVNVGGVGYKLVD